MAKYNFKGLDNQEAFEKRFSVNTTGLVPCEFQKEGLEDLTSIPANITYKMLRSKGITGNLSKKQIRATSGAFFKDLGKDVNIIFSSYQGSDLIARFADATMVKGHTSNPRGHTLAFHPLIIYQDENYLLELLDHEAKHIEE